LAHIGKYQVVQRLATGGMAELYLVIASEPQGIRRRMVLKKILPQYASDPRFVEMFLSEARIVGQLSHPNIAQVHEVGNADGSYFIAMEFVDGPNLRTVVAKATEAGQALSPLLAAKIISYACEGLGYAHEFRDPESGRPLHIVHRDISPDNIIVAGNGSVKVVDFGIAKAASQVHQTKTGEVKGKPAYMAPEQMAGRPVDHRADIYSLGVVLYELLCGERPYEAENDYALMQLILRQEPIRPLELRRPGLPVELIAIVSRALQRDPDERYPTCRAMQSDLDKLVHGAAEPIGLHDIAHLIEALGAGPSWGQTAETPTSQDRVNASPTAMERPTTPDARGTIPEVRTTPDHALLAMGQPELPPSQPATRAERPPGPRSPAFMLVAAVFSLGVLLAGAGVVISSLRRPADAEESPADAGEPPADAGEPSADGGASPADAGAPPADAGTRPPRPRPEAPRPPPVKRDVQVEVLLRSVPESQVYVDGNRVRGRELDEDVTPIKIRLPPGKYKIHFKCADGREDRQEVEVKSSSLRIVIDGQCR
jgi:serine/threonine-protein kinase